MHTTAADLVRHVLNMLPPSLFLAQLLVGRPRSAIWRLSTFPTLASCSIADLLALLLYLGLPRPVISVLFILTLFTGRWIKKYTFGLCCFSAALRGQWPWPCPGPAQTPLESRSRLINNLIAIFIFEEEQFPYYPVVFKTNSLPQVYIQIPLQKLRKRPLHTLIILIAFVTS